MPWRGSAERVMLRRMTLNDPFATHPAVPSFSVTSTTLNELPKFAGLNPSVEHFARIFWEMLASRIALRGKTLTVRLWENEHDWAAYSAQPG